MKSLKQKFQEQLELVGVPSELASQAAAIIAKDDPTKLSLGRTAEEQRIVKSAFDVIRTKQQQA